MDKIAIYGKIIAFNANNPKFMPETGEEKFLMAMEAESRSLVSDLEVVKEQLKILPSLEVKAELESQLEDIIKQIKKGEFSSNSPGEIEALSILAERLSNYLNAHKEAMISAYLKNRIKLALEKIDNLVEMIPANQKKKRNPLLDKREWK